MASKLDAFKTEIFDGSKSDKDIAREAGVTMGAVRAYRNRHKKKVAAAKTTTKTSAKKPDVKKSNNKTESRKPRTKVVTPEGVDKKCPKCGKEATGEEQIQELFGFRSVSAGKGGGKKKIPQSQCRDCRKASVKASKDKKASNKNPGVDENNAKAAAK